ncbi:histidinol-phosphatase [Clostridium sp. MSJ-8]|uniref:histidinol-phosphatase n=1 Tax=Clostridium sp. MSJ-8 TaxID=2841510 RepID=UPI001C0EFCB5|nr:histidinol-phosphatase [Clostridium sp. MSJ-8]MBU5487426.1 histidinol-phosphatase [Clostridium sp. MSJ-8]
MIRSNYHTHTYRCGHATGTEEEYIIEAIKNNTNILGISDHGPFPDVYHDFKMNFNDFPDYLNTLDELKEKYKEKIKILKAVEIEYFPQEMNFYEELLTKYNLDYLLLGQHMYYKDNNLVTYNLIDNTSYLIDYANSIKEAMETKLFSIVAHPDFFMKFFLPYDDNSKKATDIILNAAVKNNITLEINANGIRNGKFDTPDGYRYMYPFTPFWEEVAKTNIKVVVNSDCHNPKDMWDNAMLEAIEFAKQLNIEIE